MDALFTEYDRDGSNEITFRELYKMVRMHAISLVSPTCPEPQTTAPPAGQAQSRRHRHHLLTPSHTFSHLLTPSHTFHQVKHNPDVIVKAEKKKKEQPKARDAPSVALHYLRTLSHTFSHLSHLLAPSRAFHQAEPVCDLDDLRKLILRNVERKGNHQWTNEVPNSVRSQLEKGRANPTIGYSILN